MTNFQIYKKTLPLSLLMFLVDLGAIAVMVGLSTAGYFLFNQSTDKALIGLAIGFILGVIAASLIGVFVTNRFKAAQIAMMVKGVDHIVKAGFEEVRGSFGKITLFFFITNAIKNIFRRIGHSINRVGSALGGKTGDAITSAINSGVETVIGYLCDCCLGWIFFRKDINSAKAACEGVAIFFKHGKTLIRNIGRIFGMGFLSLVLVGGAFFGIIFAVLSAFPDALSSLTAEVAEAFTRNGDVVPDWLSSPTVFAIVIAVVGALIIWGIAHSVFVHPFILVGVLKNFIETGKANLPTEAEYDAIERVAPRFRRLRDKA